MKSKDKLDIRTDQDIVYLVDELIYRLKTMEGNNEDQWTDIAKSLNKHLNNFIDENDLGWDQHTFASLPKTT